MHPTILLAGTLAIAATITLGAAQPPTTKIGQLSCDVTTTSRSKLEKDHQVTCVLYASHRKIHRYYMGTVREGGRHIGKAIPGVMRWDVYVSDKAGLKGIAGTYRLNGSMPLPGMTVGGHALYGGQGNGISLRPVPGYVEHGKNFANDVSAVDLKWGEKQP